MQTSLADFIKNTPQGREANAILRKCVHCGFCTATCPTYQLLGDELDGPRGRIYLIKQFLEGNTATRRTQIHLDRCLTCRACETTCPSGVEYGRLADIGRELIETRIERPWSERLMRQALRAMVPYPKRFASLLRMGQLARPILPPALARKVPEKQVAPEWPTTNHARRMLVLEGCVQSVATPEVNAAAAWVLDRLGIRLVRTAEIGCCGALSQHLAAPEQALDFARANIDAWWPPIQQGAEAIIITASGCGVLVKDYGRLLKNDPHYRDKAAQVSNLAKDLGEVLAKEDLAQLRGMSNRKIAFHAPCTLQHGQKLPGLIESILEQLGFQLTPIPDSHLCCGSAGTYSILQQDLSQRLLENKISALESGEPELIATANIGCQLHLATRTEKPVRHWIELLQEDSIKEGRPRP